MEQAQQWGWDVIREQPCMQSAGQNVLELVLFPSLHPDALTLTHGSGIVKSG